jgi:hypothetical protein
MDDTVTVTIGGEKIALPLIMNLATLERAWPCVEVMAEAKNKIAEASAACAFVSAVLIATRPELTTGEIKKRVRVNKAAGESEMQGVVAAARELLIASGVVTPGEAEAAPAAE